MVHKWAAAIVLISQQTSMYQVLSRFFSTKADSQYVLSWLFIICSFTMFCMQGGTASAPSQLNDRNKGHPDTYWGSPADCHFMVVLQQPGDPPAGQIPPTALEIWSLSHSIRSQAGQLQHVCDCC